MQQRRAEGAHVDRVDPEPQALRCKLRGMILFLQGYAPGSEALRKRSCLNLDMNMARLLARFENFRLSGLGL